jgi:hypothetical protein
LTATEIVTVKVVAQGDIALASSKLTVYLKAGRNNSKKEQPHEALANLRDEAAASWAFFDRWGPLHSEQLIPLEKAKELRDAKLPPPYVNLEWRDHLRAAWRGDKDAIEFLERYTSGGHYSRFHWHFQRGRLELEAEDLWTTICLLFLRDRVAHKIAICENPDCASPFFIRSRCTQKFCEAGPCVEYGARIRANRWWHTHGEQWRKGNRKGRKQQ